MIEVFPIWGLPLPSAFSELRCNFVDFSSGHRRTFRIRLCVRDLSSHAMDVFLCSRLHVLARNTTACADERVAIDTLGRFSTSLHIFSKSRSTRVPEATPRSLESSYLERTPVYSSNALQRRM